MYTKPLAPSLFDKQTADGIILQSSPSSCVAASAANILKIYGMDTSEKELAALFGTTLMTGTTAAQLVYGMRRIGFEAVMKYIENADISAIEAPAVLFVAYGSTENHAVALLKYSENDIEVADPLSGRKHLSQEQLGKIWHGRALELRKM